MKLDRLGGSLKFPKQPYGIKGPLFWRKHFFTALDTLSDATCWRVSLRHSLAHSQLDIHHTYIQPGPAALFIKDPCGTRAADEWVFAGRQCEITRLLFFITVSAKRYPRAHTPDFCGTARRFAAILTDNYLPNLQASLRSPSSSFPFWSFFLKRHSSVQTPFCMWSISTSPNNVLERSSEVESSTKTGTPGLLIFTFSCTRYESVDNSVQFEDNGPLQLSCWDQLLTCESPRLCCARSFLLLLN